MARERHQLGGSDIRWAMAGGGGWAVAASLISSGGGGVGGDDGAGDGDGSWEVLLCD